MRAPSARIEMDIPGPILAGQHLRDRRTEHGRDSGISASSDRSTDRSSRDESDLDLCRFPIEDRDQ
jgi:hypothetical protein